MPGPMFSSSGPCMFLGLPAPWWLPHSPIFVCYWTDDLETHDHLCYLEPGGKKPGSAWVWGQHGGLGLGSRGPGPFLPARLASWPGLGPSPLFCRHMESLWVCYSRCHCCCLFVSCSPLSTSLCVPACHCLLITGTFPDTSLVPG